MYPLVLCFCGQALGHIYDAFKQMRAYKYTKLIEDLGFDIDVNSIPINDDINMDLLDVFEALKVDKLCCRGHLNTQVEMKDLY